MIAMLRIHGFTYYVIEGGVQYEAFYWYSGGVYVLLNTSNVECTHFIDGVAIADAMNTISPLENWYVKS